MNEVHLGTAGYCVHAQYFDVLGRRRFSRKWQSMRLNFDVLGRRTSVVGQCVLASRPAYRSVKSSYQGKEQKKVPWAVEYQNPGLSWIYPIQ
jgi:hypothetical protein